MKVKGPFEGESKVEKKEREHYGGRVIRKRAIPLDFLATTHWQKNFHFVKPLDSRVHNYLLLAPQGRVLIWERVPISVLKNKRMFKTKLEDDIACLKELCAHMDIIVDKFRQRLLFS